MVRMAVTGPTNPGELPEAMAEVRRVFEEQVSRAPSIREINQIMGGKVVIFGGVQPLVARGLNLAANTYCGPGGAIRLAASSAAGCTVGYRSPERLTSPWPCSTTWWRWCWTGFPWST